MYLFNQYLFFPVYIWGNIFTKFVSRRRHESILFLRKRTQKLAPLIFPNKQLIRRRLRGYTAALMKSFLRIKMIKTENESDGAALSQMQEKDSKRSTQGN